MLLDKHPGYTQQLRRLHLVWDSLTGAFIGGGFHLKGGCERLQVKDIVFLHKYNEPVLLVLHEVAPTWPARYRDSKDTMALAALSINVVHKRHPKIWDAAALPSDTFKLIPVPTGGALALSQNMIMYFTQVSALVFALLWCATC